MKAIYILIYMLVFFIPPKAFAQNNTYTPTRLFTVAETREDLAFFKNKLEKTHPNLYAYTTKEDLNTYFDSLAESLVNPMTELEFYNIITLLNSKIKDGHTMLLPASEWSDYYSNNGKFLPFYMLATKDKMYINMNCSADTSLSPGTEIISINGTSVSEIMSRLLERQIRDGYNETYPLWILNTYFKSYYSFTYGHPDKFIITYKNKNAVETETVAALPNDSIKFYKKLNYQNRINDSTDNKGITLELMPDIKTAVLTIKDFHNDILKDVYKQNFRNTIDNYFNQLTDAGTASLIIDIRNNQGGDIENGKILLSWLVSQPFNIIDAGPSSGAMQPNKKSFKGKVYMLTNGGSFSNSGIVSSFLEKNNRAIFIGEETGGNKITIYGNPKSFTLPNTNIQCEISSTVYSLRASAINDGHGVMPSYYIVPSIDDIINNIDRVKEFTMELIRKDH